MGLFNSLEGVRSKGARSLPPLGRIAHFPFLARASGAFGCDLFKYILLFFLYFLLENDYYFTVSLATPPFKTPYFSCNSLPPPLLS